MVYWGAWWFLHSVYLTCCSSPLSRPFFLLWSLLAVGPLILFGGWVCVCDRFDGRIRPARCSFLAVALLGGYLSLGGYLFLLVVELWLFRRGGAGRVRLLYCLLVLVAVGRSWWAAWVSPPWLVSIWGVSYRVPP
jgi:hypothetical protein